LFEALYGRRSRRFGLGFEMPEGPFRYQSAHTPVSLSEIEEALLVGAGAGFSGLAFWDLPTPAPYRRRGGRTFPTTRPGGHTALFFTNDEGLYILDAKPHMWSCDNPDHDPWPAEAWRIRRGAWCPACAGNRPLGIDGLRAWGQEYGLELLNDKYSGTAQSYRWRCLAAGHDICRTKGNIEQSLRKQLPACDVCAAEKVGSKAGGRERDKADEFAQRLIPLIDEIRTAGTTSLTGIANELNGRSIRTSLGRRWYASTVKNLLTRLSSGRGQN